ncbi:hypothetical protein SO694_000056116 [Aureococcus anophagefferens]|uniref:Uncharacterized protein n=1 Tax=Aureococcus anophagefferens TaxID=44056 RepID=A0ABR1GA41_AURAN
MADLETMDLAARVGQSDAFSHGVGARRDLLAHIEKLQTDHHAADEQWRTAHGALEAAHASQTEELERWKAARAKLEADHHAADEHWRAAHGELEAARASQADELERRKVANEQLEADRASQHDELERASATARREPRSARGGRVARDGLAAAVRDAGDAKAEAKLASRRVLELESKLKQAEGQIASLEEERAVLSTVKASENDETMARLKGEVVSLRAGGHVATLTKLIQQCHDVDSSNLFKKSHVAVKKAVLKVVAKGDWDGSEKEEWGCDDEVMARIHTSWSKDQCKLFLKDMEVLVVAFENMTDGERDNVPRTLAEITHNVGPLVQISRICREKLGAAPPR